MRDKFSCPLTTKAAFLFFVEMERERYDAHQIGWLYSLAKGKLGKAISKRQHGFQPSSEVNFKAARSGKIKHHSK